MWLWTWQKHQLQGVDCQARLGLIYCVYMFGTWMSCAKNSWLDRDVVLGLCHVGPRNHELDWIPDPPQAGALLRGPWALTYAWQMCQQSARGRCMYSLLQGLIRQDGDATFFPDYFGHLISYVYFMLQYNISLYWCMMAFAVLDLPPLFLCCVTGLEELVWCNLFYVNWDIEP